MSSYDQGHHSTGEHKAGEHKVRPYGNTDVMQGRDAWHRHSIRLPDFDYARNGAYFVTICIQDRACLLGSLSDGTLCPSDAGRMVATHWEDLPGRFPGLALDAFVVMPNHFHGVLILDKNEAGEREEGEHEVRPYADLAPRAGETCVRPQSRIRSQPLNRPNGTAEDSVGRIIQAFKSLTTTAYTRGVQTLGWPEFQGRLWQRNYYDHIVRDDADLSRIRTYIATNPANLNYSRREEREGVLIRYGRVI